jgi:hypothetical protein
MLISIYLPNLANPGEVDVRVGTWGWSLLMFGAAAVSLTVVEYLLLKGANPNHKAGGEYNCAVLTSVPPPIVPLCALFRSKGVFENLRLLSGVN